MSDHELDQWRGAWVAQQPAAPDIGPWLAQARRRHRLGNLSTAVAVAASLAFFAGYLGWASGTGEPELVWLGALGCAWVGGLAALWGWLGRGTWRAANRSTRDFLALTARRERATLRYLALFPWLAVGWGLLIAALVVLRASRGGAGLSLELGLALAAGTLATAAVTRWAIGRQRRTAERALKAARALLAEAEPGSSP